MLGMDQESLSGCSGDPVVDGDLVHPVCCSEPYKPSGLSQDRSGPSHRTILRTQQTTSRSMQPHDEEALEQELSRMTATYDSHYLKNGSNTGHHIANARRHPQNTHARATSCGMYTCVHRRWS